MSITSSHGNYFLHWHWIFPTSKFCVMNATMAKAIGIKLIGVDPHIFNFMLD